MPGRAGLESRQRGVGDGAAPSRARVRDLGPVRSYELSFDARTAYDFLISMSIGDGAESDLLPAERDWLAATRDALEPDVRAEMDTCSIPAREGFLHALTGLIVDDPGLRDAASVRDALRAAGPRGLARQVVGPLLPPRSGAALLERALDGNRGALESLAEALPEEERPAILGLLSDLEGTVARMDRLLSAWLPAFERIEQRVANFEATDVASRAAELMALDSDGIIERVTGGVRWFAEPRVRRVIMAPCYFARPYNFLYHGSDWRLFCYPIADQVLEQAEPDTPPQGMLRLHRALGDASRLRILRLLRERDLYLTELALELDLSKPTTKHHLALLRAAGLVTVTEEGGLTYYSLRRERIAEGAEELRAYLG